MAIDWKLRNELTYEWVAKYNDGTELRQYNEAIDSEFHFGNIDQGKLVEFVLVSRSDPNKTFSVNLLTGMFSVDGKEVNEISVNDQPVSLGLRFTSTDKVESKMGSKASLIYFRRIQRAVNPFNNTADGRTIEVPETGLLGMWQFIGLEATINGIYHKFEIAIDKDGKILIPPKSNFTPI